MAVLERSAGILMKKQRLITFQPWKVALILCMLTVFISAISIVELFDALGADYGDDPLELSKEISLHIMSTLGGLCISLPFVIVVTYLMKILLWITKGVTITISEDWGPE